MNDGLPLPGLCQSNHGLSGTDDLSGFGQGLHHNPIGICHQSAIARGMAGNHRLGFCGAEISLGSSRCGLDLFIGRYRNGSGVDQVAITCFLECGLSGQGMSCGDRLLLYLRLQAKVYRVEPHQWLATFDRLSGIDQAFQHLARDTKAQFSLHARGDNAAERARAIGRLLNGSGFD